MDQPPIGLIIGIFVVLGIVSLVVRLSFARKWAREAGIDEGAATAATLFGTGAETSLYLAAHRVDREDGDEGHVIADLPRHDGG